MSTSGRTGASLAAILVLAGACAHTPEVAPTAGGEWITQPPPPDLCEPGQEVIVDENLIANCTAMTKDFGDWWLELTAGGAEFLGWEF